MSENEIKDIFSNTLLENKMVDGYIWKKIDNKSFLIICDSALVADKILGLPFRNIKLKKMKEGSDHVR